MTIDEAIKILEAERHDHHSLSTDIIGQAEILGITALQRERERRFNSRITERVLLSGETME